MGVTTLPGAASGRCHWVMPGQASYQQAHGIYGIYIELTSRKLIPVFATRNIATPLGWDASSSPVTPQHFVRFL